MLRTSFLVLTVSFLVTGGFGHTASADVSTLNSIVNWEHSTGNGQYLITPEGTGSVVAMSVLIVGSDGFPIAGFSRDRIKIVIYGGSGVNTIGCGSTVFEYPIVGEFDYDAGSGGQMYFNKPLRGGGQRPLNGLGLAVMVQTNDGRWFRISNTSRSDSSNGWSRHLVIASPDIDADGSVGLSDSQIFSTDFYTGNNPYRSDFNFDGIVNLGDVIKLSQSNGQSCP